MTEEDRQNTDTKSGLSTQDMLMFFPVTDLEEMLKICNRVEKGVLKDRESEDLSEIESKQLIAIRRFRDNVVISMSSPLREID